MSVYEFPNTPLEIIAEMRRPAQAEERDWADYDATLRDFADRLEDSIKAEKQEWCRKMDEVWQHFDEYRHAVESEQKTPVREMLLQLERFFMGILACQRREYRGAIVQIPADTGFWYLDKIRAALGAPRKNAERFADSWEVMKAWDGSLEDAAGVVRLVDWLLAPEKKEAGPCPEAKQE